MWPTESRAADITRTLEPPPGSEAPGSASGADAVAVGSRVAGRYAILAWLGRGGMGDVYEALDEELHDRVAIKVLRRADAATQARFRREVQLARRVTHPGVCRIFDLGVSDDVWFCTMELVAGETLAARLARIGRLDARAALAIARSIGAALAAAHAAGVVHGDLKPSNVLLAASGRVVVSDFGLARALGEHAEPGLGSPAYVAPEQLGGAATGSSTGSATGSATGSLLGPATDIYALGVVLFELATGARPFTGPTADAIARARLDRVAPPARGAPRRWRRVIAQCLARDPADRPASVAAVVASLAAPRRRGLALAAVVAVGGLALAGYAAAPSTGEIEAGAAGASDPCAASPACTTGLAALRGLHFAAARDAFHAAIAAAPASVVARLGLAEAAWSLGAEPEARGAAQEALDLAEHASRAMQLAAEAHYWETSGRPQQAAARYAELAALAPADAEPRFQLLRAQWHAADPAGVRATIEQLRARAPRDPRLAIAELRIARGDGAWPRVIEIAPRLAGADAPVAFEVLMAEGEANWALGDLSGARTALRAALALARAGGDGNGEAGVQYTLGLIALDAGELRAALAAFTAIPAGAPDVRGTFVNRQDGLARTALAAGQLAEAGRALEAARDAARQSEGHQFHAARIARTGAALALALGDVDQARRLADEAITAFRRLGLAGDQALALTVASEAAAAAADLPAARAALDEALA
ncbi:MAG TPA: serine/threonine-protein kinase, partial [Kofleriaceae bacterium]